MASRRQERFTHMVHRELSYIFLLEGKKIFRDTIVNVTRVIVSPDLGYVKVYLSFINNRDKDMMMEMVNQNAGQIRRLFGNRLRNEVRKIPQLAFYYDESMDYVEKMDKLFDKIKSRKENDNPKVNNSNTEDSEQ